MASCASVFNLNDFDPPEQTAVAGLGAGGKPIHQNGPQVEFHWIWWESLRRSHSIWMVNESNESWVSGSDVSPNWSKHVKSPWISGADVPGLEAVRPAHGQRPGLRDGRGPDSPFGRPKRRPRPCRLGAMGSWGHGASHSGSGNSIAAPPKNEKP